MTEPKGQGTGRRLDDGQRLDWLRLIRSENVGPRTFRAAVNHFGGAAAALDGLPALAREKGGRRIKICTREDAAREMDLAGRMGVRFVATGEPEYPRALQAIDAAPPLLAVRGNVDCLARPCAGIVGSRNASASGLAMARRLARGLGEAGFVVVSGLARGIDAAAHQASAATGSIAVLAGGHSRIYPPEHEALLQELLEAGAAISEMPLAWEPRGRDFPRRNRLVSGMALGLIVVEAARRSGSLITAKFALEQGRELFGVPGSPLDPRAEGPNDLIRQGAVLVTSAEDVIAVLAPLVSRDGGTPPETLEEHGPDEPPLWDELDLFAEPAQAAWIADGPPTLTTPAPAKPHQDTPCEHVLALIGVSPVGLDDVIRASGLTVRDVRSALLELELAGRIIRVDADRYALSAPHPTGVNAGG
jgi:DNA processing protein